MYRVLPTCFTRSETLSTVVRKCSERWINAYEQALNRTMRDLDGKQCNYEKFCNLFDERLLDEIRMLRFYEV